MGPAEGGNDRGVKTSSDDPGIRLPVSGGNSSSSSTENLFASWRDSGGSERADELAPCLPLRATSHGSQGSRGLGVELAEILGLAPSWAKGSAGSTEALAGPTTTRESITHSSSLIWYKLDILLSSSEIFWIRRRQLSQAEGEVSGGMTGVVQVTHCCNAKMLKTIYASSLVRFSSRLASRNQEA